MLLVPGRGQDVLFDLINTHNAFPTPLSGANAVLGSPKVSADLPNGTLVTVHGRLGGLYTGRVEIKYQRFDLTSAFLGLRPQVSGLGAESLYKMLGDINQVLGTGLAAEEIEDVAFDWATLGDIVPITIRALPTSLIYQGEFTLDFTRIRPAMEEAIPVAEVDPYSELETPVEGKASVAMATWGVDFSAERRFQRLSVVNGDWSSPATISTLMRKEFGFSPWPAVDVVNYPLEDMATADVSVANQDFERVIIQRNVIGDTFAGTAYLHYNR